MLLVRYSCYCDVTVSPVCLLLFVNFLIFFWCDLKHKNFVFGLRTKLSIGRIVENIEYYMLLLCRLFMLSAFGFHSLNHTPCQPKTSSNLRLVSTIRHCHLLSIKKFVAHCGCTCSFKTHTHTHISGVDPLREPICSLTNVTLHEIQPKTRTTPKVIIIKHTHSGELFSKLTACVTIFCQSFPLRGHKLSAELPVATNKKSKDKVLNLFGWISLSGDMRALTVWSRPI